MATALHTLVRNPNPNLCGKRAPLARPPYSPLSRSVAPAVRRLDAAGASLRNRYLGARLLSVDLRISRLVPLAAQHEESENSDVGVEMMNDELEVQANDLQEAWKQKLESFTEEALKLKGMSQEACELYSKKAMVMLQEASEKLKIEAEKARQDLGVVANEISVEGKEYLASVAKNSPDEVKDIVETFASVDELKHVSAVRDFYIGIPYGALLALGGFISFMLTGSIQGIRFGVIPGTALMALSILSLRSWKSGKPSPLILKGQAAIAAILFIKEWCLFSQLRSFPTLLMSLSSGAILGFYIYRILMNGQGEGSSSKQASE